MKKFDSFRNITDAGISELKETDGFNDKLASSLFHAVRKAKVLDDIEKLVEENFEIMQRRNFQFVTYLDQEFPSVLRRIYDPPLFLFVMGTYQHNDDRAIAIVGTRTPSDYGKQATATLVKQLSGSNTTIVSGLALGIDTIAHTSALASGARTIAVLGSGLNNIYPFANQALADRISVNGCVISELPLNAKPDAVNFPRRNRIISGLSMGTVVVESGMRGGAIITAELALDQNREVLAVPGNIFSSKSDGTNQLIKSGLATMVTNVEDIFVQIPVLRNTSETNKNIPALQLNLLEQSVVENLSLDPVQIDVLSEKTALSTSDLLVLLLQLEFKGIVRQLPGKYFILSRM